MCGGGGRSAPRRVCADRDGGPGHPPALTRPGGAGGRESLGGEDSTVVACVATLPAAAPDSQDRPDPSSTRHSGIAIAPVEGQLASLGRSRQAVLIEGEPGSGRSHVARAIHRQRRSPSPRNEAARSSRRTPRKRSGSVRAGTKGAGRCASGTSTACGFARRASWPSSSRRAPVGDAAGDWSRAPTATSIPWSRPPFHRELFTRLSVRRLRLPPLRERKDELRRSCGLSGGPGEPRLGFDRRRARAAAGLPVPGQSRRAGAGTAPRTDDPAGYCRRRPSPRTG